MYSTHLNQNKLLLSLAVFFAFISSSTVFAQFETEEKTNFTADYVNSMFYYKNLDHLRNAYNRISGLSELKSPSQSSGAKPVVSGYSVIYDFNYGRNVEGESKVPMLLGTAFVKKNIGFHALISTTDLRILSNGSESWEEKFQEDPKRFMGTSIGLSYNTKWVSVLGDITYAQKNVSYFGQLNIPIIKLRAGIGVSKYEEFIDSLGYTTIVQGNNFNPDYYFINSSVLKFIDIGFSVLNYSQVQVSPYFSFSLYQLRKRNKWHELKYDAEFYFQTHAPDYKNIFELKDYDARATFYYLGKPLMGGGGDAGKSISTRPTFFVGVSYKSGVDYITETMRNAGIFYTGPKGWGGEMGVGYKVLGLKRYNVSNETFLKLSVYYNYSEYFEVWPSLIGGLKFRVLL